MGKLYITIVVDEVDGNLLAASFWLDSELSACFSLTDYKNLKRE